MQSKSIQLGDDVIENAYYRMLDAAPDALVIADSEGIIRLVNVQTETLFGYQRQELLGEPIELLLPHSLRAAHVGHRERYAEAPKLRAMGSGLELLGRRKDGSEFPLEVSLSPLETEAGLFVLSALRDVTELRKVQLVAERASAAKSEFLASMSHELRTPLNAILGFAQLLQRDKKTPLTERQQTKVAHILKGGEHLLRLIDDVLDLARIEAGRVSISLEPVDLADVLHEVQTTLEPMASRPEVVLRVEGPAAQHGLVLADRVRLAQVLMNFGSNAIKYGKRRGEVRFVVSQPRPGVLRISVADDGEGIAPDKQARLFEPFQRGGQELGPIEGTGIGLMICKRLVGLMGGELGFHSELGVGSTFWVELPEHAGAAGLSRAVTQAAPLESDTAAVQRVVVYIEDNPSNIAFMRDVMEELSHVKLLTAPTAEIGIELVRSRLPDLVLMDINLPGMNGIEAAQKLRAWPETRDIPVVALTAAALMRDGRRSDVAVFARYLTKPLRVDELTSTLEDLLAHKA